MITENQAQLASKTNEVDSNRQRIVQRRKQGVSNLIQGRVSAPNTTQQSSQKKERELDHVLLKMKRVTKVHSGGKRMRMSVFMVVGDKKGRLAIGSGKGIDTKIAQEKALERAKRKLVKVNLKGRTIPHEITVKFGAAKVMLKPAAPGTGIIAGGPVRKVLEMAGVSDILTKQLGCSNPVSNAYATMKGLTMLKK